MKMKRTLMTLWSIGLLGVGLQTACAHDQKAPSPAQPYAIQDSQVAMDPVMQALLIAMMARMLREAAASPDPMGALAKSLESTVDSALANPETLRMVEALAGQAFRDVPDELRQALVSFAVSMFAQMRREMLEKRRTVP